MIKKNARPSFQRNSLISNNFKSMKKLYVMCLLLLGVSVHAAIQNDELYIVSDSLTLVDNSKMPYQMFSSSAVMEDKNMVFNIQVGDTLKLRIHNLDSEVHNFQVKGTLYPVSSISSGDSVDVEMVFNDPGCYIYYDPLNFPDNKSMGLAGMINVKDHNHSSFYWNIKEFQKNKVFSVDSGNVQDWSDYYPNYFMINSKSNPGINMDLTARVTGEVGDTIMIYMCNTGQSIHSMHYHGYHLDLIHDSKFPNNEGRSKDTFALFPMESMVLRLIPDKPGEYPVHDHNLVGVTANMVYPNGMFTTLLISQ
jgi:FtsP/CotA-like multicopper oxidase with cupredoxin domain